MTVQKLIDTTMNEEARYIEWNDKLRTNLAKQKQELILLRVQQSKMLAALKRTKIVMEQIKISQEDINYLSSVITEVK